jgi:hypothetical protein
MHWLQWMEMSSSQFLIVSDFIFLFTGYQQNQTRLIVINSFYKRLETPLPNRIRNIINKLMV